MNVLKYQWSLSIVEYDIFHLLRARSDSCCSFLRRFGVFRKIKCEQQCWKFFSLHFRLMEIVCIYRVLSGRCMQPSSVALKYCIRLFHPVAPQTGINVLNASGCNLYVSFVSCSKVGRYHGAHCEFMHIALCV